MSEQTISVEELFTSELDALNEYIVYLENKEHLRKILTLSLYAGLRLNEVQRFKHVTVNNVPCIEIEGVREEQTDDHANEHTRNDLYGEVARRCISKYRASTLR